MADQSDAPVSLLRLRRRGRLAELAYFAGEYLTIALTGHRPPGRLMRLVYRLPVWLYRGGLGWLAGGSTLLLTTRGRRSGLPRYAALGYTYDEAADAYYVVAGWPEGSDWFRNLKAEPRAAVRVGGRRFAAVAEAAAEGLALELLRDFNRRNPFAARVWSKLTGGAFDGSEAALRDLARRHPVVVFRPSREGGGAG